MLKLQEKILSKNNKLLRLCWRVVWVIFYRPSPIPFFGWRRILLRIFGAKIASDKVHIYPSSRIWAPWNLIMERNTCLSHYVDCYNVDIVHLYEDVTVSQYSFLCTASHDYTQKSMPLVTAPIIIKKQAWVTADVFIGPGVIVGEGAIIGARSTVLKDVPAWAVVSGNPAKKIKMRVIKD